MTTRILKKDLQPPAHNRRYGRLVEFETGMDQFAGASHTTDDYTYDTPQQPTAPLQIIKINVHAERWGALWAVDGRDWESSRLLVL